MIEIHPYDALGHHDFGWLNARYHFSFADYQDRNRMHFGVLRVVNDDIVKSGAGFAPHPHNDMEIITYVRTGAISHRDSLGNEGRTAAGDVQVMSAGSGITHEEFKPNNKTRNCIKYGFIRGKKTLRRAGTAASFLKSRWMMRCICWCPDARKTRIKTRFTSTNMPPFTAALSRREKQFTTRSRIRLIY